MEEIKLIQNVPSLPGHCALPPADLELFSEAWYTTRAWHGHDFTFYLPGMIRIGNTRGRYPALSLTGDHCDLRCLHCSGMLLKSMPAAGGPDDLVERGRLLAKRGNHGILLTGGANRNGELPWDDYLGAISTLHRETPLHLSAHTGFPDLRVCSELKRAGIRQALLDVMGDRKTAREVYRLPGLQKVFQTIDAIKDSDLEWVPHVIAGLYFGQIAAEYEALEIIRRNAPAALVIVVLSPLKGTAMSRVKPPAPLEVARLIATARRLMPDIPISLGCERPRNREGLLLERLALRAGVTRMAVWSEEAVHDALSLGLRPRFQATCCSLGYRPDYAAGHPYETA